MEEITPNTRHMPYCNPTRKEGGNITPPDEPPDSCIVLSHNNRQLWTLLYFEFGKILNNIPYLLTDAMFNRVSVL